MQLLRAFEVWTGRGLLEVLVGLLFGGNADDQEFGDALPFYQIITYSAIAMGGLHFIGGALCLDRIRKHRLAHRHKAVEAAQELAHFDEEMQARKQHLEEIVRHG